MTRLSPTERCGSCSGPLVPPELASGFQVPDATDYVCLKCGRPYRWTNSNPPRLATPAVERRVQVEEDDEG